MPAASGSAIIPLAEPDISDVPQTAGPRGVLNGMREAE
jgi:hypothetical protein